MPSPSDQAQTSLRSMRANSRSPQLPDNTVGAPAQKKGGKKASQPASNSRIQNLQETRKKGRMKLNKSSDEDIASQLQKLDLRRSDAIATGTALVCDDRLTNYHCLWDKNAPECPARLTAVKEKLAHYGLTKRCIAVQAREAVDEEILLVHSPEYLERMKSTQSMTEEELLALSNSYDSIYLHPKSYSSACLAGGSVLQLVDMVFAGEARNGMAVVRPPGHHAQWEKMNGYCMFNNIAMAARYAQHNHGASRILIVDWDVHHGQGTQYMFEDDPSVLYFSIHRYEEGHFWPHLPESDSNAVGEGRGEGFTINVPWNKVGMTDADYIAAFLNLLLPIAHEFQPHLVLVAAGFDSVVGDPKGEMAASPACFAHLTHLLMPLAGGKLILALEGGYNLRSLAEGSCAALKILLGDPCPRLSSPVAACHSALTSISETIACHYKYWKSLRHYGEVDLTQEEEEEQDGVAWSTADELDALLDTEMAEVMRELPPERTGLVYDERMMEHFNAWDSHHPELPQRISRIYERHVEQRLVERCCRLPARHASDDNLQMCHSLEYIQTIRSTAEMKQRDLHRLGGEYNSIFINPSSYDCARLATGCSFSAVEAVMTGKVQNAVAIVRPPGHHAERDTACGFCFFNTAALAARYAQRIAGRMLKVMILDWDVHHGNGTQHIFEDDPSVLYASIHRYDHSTFFPASTDANYDRVGRGSGAGFNVNIAWNNSKMGDAEYLMAFHRAVMPIAYEFNPDLVLVSAGFDAARGDPLGGCLVSPEGYAHMIHLLMGLAGGKIVVVLEGGYNLSSISESMTMCTRTLLGDTLPDLGKLRAPHRTAQQSVSNTIRVHKKYWKSLQLNVPEFVTPAEEAAEELSGTPTKSHSPTTEQSTASISLNNSPGRTVTPVDIADKHDTKQAESQVVLLSLLEEPQTYLETGGSQEVRSIEESIVPASESKNPGNTLSTENNCELDKAAAPMDQMSSLEKPETPIQNESGHDLILVVKPGIPLSTSMKPWIPEIFEKDHELGKEGGAGKCISLSGEQMSSVSLKNDHQPEKQEELVYAMPSSRNAENSAMSVKDLEQHTDPMSPLLKTDNPVMSVAQHEVIKGISAVSNLETTMSTENDQKMETDAPKAPFLKFGKQDVAQESRADPGKDPTVVLSLPLSVPEKTKIHVGTVETGLLQLIAQKSVPLVDAMANTNPEKAGTAAKSGCSAVVEPIKPVGLNKDNNKTLTADMKFLQLSAAEPAPIEQICDLKAHLGDRQRDSLMRSKDFIVDQSSHERPTLAVSSYQSLSSVPVGGARRKVKPCIKLSDASPTAGSSSPTFASSSSPAASSPTSVSVAFSDSSGQTISTAVKTPVSASPEAPLPSSTCLTQLASPAAPPVFTAVGPVASSRKPSSPSIESEGSTISGRKCNVETVVGNEGCHSDDCVVEISLSLQVVDMKDHSQQETPGDCASTSPKKDELLEEATGWTNPLTSRPHCQLFGNRPEEESGTLFAVTPLPWCPHLETVQAVPPCGLNVQEGCCDCGSTVENWVCLVCYEVYCGRYINEHMLMHGLAAGHMVVLSYADLSVWCYSCESYVHNEVLSDVKNVAHRMKFGEDVA